MVRVLRPIELKYCWAPRRTSASPLRAFMLAIRAMLTMKRGLTP